MTSLKRHVLTYGMVGGAMIALLQITQYRFLVVEHSVEIYAALVAIAFSALGIWLGLRMTARRERVVVREVAVPVPAPTTAAFEVDEARREELGITPREMEILGLIAEGLSNREIAERAFVSESTVKTHLSRLFDKLGAKRRTQAVQMAKEQRLLP